MGLKERIEAIEVDSRDASFTRYEAAQLAAESYELMAEMAKSISELQAWITDGGYEDTAEGVAGMCGEARCVMHKYNQYKDKTND